MSEADLCAGFRTWATAKGWAVHPEVGDWDMVLTPSETGVREERYNALGDLTRHLGWIPGQTDQVGVQAKLLGNVDVLAQATRGRHTGPAWRLVLVPRPSDNFIELADRLGILVAHPEVQLGRRGFARGAKVQWRAASNGFEIDGHALSVPVSRQLELPPIVTDMPAGTRSPKQLTKWKVKALRLCRRLKNHGYLTPADFKTEKVDKRIWLDRWLDTCRESGNVVYTARPGAELPDVGWEEVSAALAEKEYKP